MEVNCLSCIHKDVCLKRNMAVFTLFIQSGRYAEVDEARQTLDVSADCYDWKGDNNA